MTSRVLTLSAHTGQLDRRIIAGLNTTAGSGRRVTLVTTPVTIEPGLLDERVDVVMAPGPAAIDVAHGAAGRLPGVISRPLRAAWRLRPTRRPPWSVLVDLANADDVHVIHCHDLDTLPAAVAIRDSACPAARILYDAHELFPLQYANKATRRYWSRVERRHIGSADAIVTVNETMADEIVRLYGVARPTVVFNGYDAPEPAASIDERGFLEHFAAPAAEFKVIFQGGLLGDRNLDRLVDAFSRIGDGIHLFLLGEGPHEATLRRAVATGGIDNVHFGRFVPQSALAGMISCADLGVIPYPRTYDHCSPNKLFEFIALGLPVCAADLTELRRIIRSEGIGAVYPMDTAEEIAAAIGDCARRCRAGQFTSSSFIAAREKYSWRAQGQVLLEVLDGLEG